MKRKALTTLFTLAFVVGLTGSAFAGSGTFTVSEGTWIQGQELKAGEYKATWSDSGEIAITNNSGTRLKVQGKVVERAEKSPSTSVLKQASTKGGTQVKEVRFSGKKTVLIFGEADVAQQK